MQKVAFHNAVIYFNDFALYFYLLAFETGPLCVHRFDDLR